MSLRLNGLLAFAYICPHFLLNEPDQALCRVKHRVVGRNRQALDLICFEEVLDHLSSMLGSVVKKKHDVFVPMDLPFAVLNEIRDEELSKVDGCEGFVLNHEPFDAVLAQSYTTLKGQLVVGHSNVYVSPFGGPGVPFPHFLVYGELVHEDKADAFPKQLQDYVDELSFQDLVLSRFEQLEDQADPLVALPHLFCHENADCRL